MKNFIHIFIILGLVACEKKLVPCLENQGPIVQRKVEIQPFTAVNLTLNGQLIFNEGPEQEVIIEASDNVIDRILRDSKFDNNQWEIGTNGCVDIRDIIIHITVPTIRSIDIFGEGSVISEDIFKNIDRLRLGSSGNSSIDFAVESVEEIEIDVWGEGRVLVRGQTSRQKIDVRGSAEINTTALETKECTIMLFGESNCKVHVTDKLNINLSGSGEVCYLGDPTIHQSIFGSGSVGSCN